MIRNATLVASLMTVAATTFADARGVIVVPIFISRPAVRPWQLGDPAKLGPPTQEGCFNKYEMFNPSNGAHVGWQRIRIAGCRGPDDPPLAKSAKAVKTAKSPKPPVKVVKEISPKTDASSKP